MTLTSEVPAPLGRFWKWQLHAQCRNVNANLFFPCEGEGKGARLRRERAAKQICTGCPVRPECHDHAVTADEAFGVWGGTSESERRRLTSEFNRTTSPTRAAAGLSLRHPAPSRQVQEAVSDH
ncbi:WhiB family transcriptional regulator [Rhodococcus opacus]|uniref:Transcriptional regulator WhiB n=1 Tax=Rhodococcus opacus TaxID=37919 RepID=A0A2S8IUC4_RHOOP|nr:WhiB family transcriptional regulator [Rhodococcus opacus]PQP17952.1 WhiB family transcriptional regulator [Rhodococcus opacus]